MLELNTYQRPPSEADSFIIRVAHGCPHNKCTFCNIFKTVAYRPIPLEEVLAGIDLDVEDLGELLPAVKSVYLEGGDPLILPAKDLLRIMRHASEKFPALGRFTCYATARSVIRKTKRELKSLAEAGLRRVFVGLESGLDLILEQTHKGCTSADILLAGNNLNDAGIENDVSMMLGIGGEKYSERHALATASLLSKLSPACVRIRTFVPKSDTPLGQDFLTGEFILQTPYSILNELRLMVENISGPTLLLSEHWTDYLKFKAKMPEHKQFLLAAVDNALKMPLDAFRKPDLSDRRF